MSKVFASWIIMMILPVGSLTVALRVQPCRASPLTITVPDDYPRIQEAINNASDGDTVFVRNGTYYERVAVNKSVSVIGESQKNTVVDGFNVTYPFAVFYVNVSNVFISNFTIRGGGDSWAESGIALIGSSETHIVNNDISGSWGGIFLQGSQNNSFLENHIHSTTHSAVYSYESFQNIFLDNDIDSNWQGIWLSNSYNNTLRANTISNNSYYGMNLSYGNSINNTIVENNVRYNQYGISLFVTYNGRNYFYHNNIIDNIHQVYIEGEPSNNSWDNGYPSGGNCWSDYHGADLYSGTYQNETGADNIGDSPYIIDANNIDGYPLVSVDIAITRVASTKTVIGRGFSANISVTLKNQGNLGENFTVYANTTENSNQTVFNIPGGAQVTLDFNWSTTELEYSYYTISAYVHPVPGEIDITDNNGTSTQIVVTIPGDVNGDFIVDIYDAVLLGGCFSSHPLSPHWNPNTDINGDNLVDIYDAIILANHYNQHYP